MEETIPLGSEAYFIFLAALTFGRGMDFLSTWVATPNLVLEANPIARKLGWKWGLLLNVALCGGFARWPLAAVIITTTSLLVAARNFQSAWLMRYLGELRYSSRMIEHLERVPLGLYLGCLAGQTFLVGGVGACLMFFCDLDLIPFGIGVGLVGYAFAVLFYSLLSLWRIRRQSAKTYAMTDPDGPEQ
ncbi:MAG: hypothetical protein WCO56_14040 [Verrucomicrobiota bacterium]